MDTIKDLYMGCGKQRLDGWLHADIYPYPSVDVVCDATKEWPWPDNTFERVFTRDFMEHLPPTASVHVINEMWRVLKPGGTMEHFIPNAGSCNDFGSPSHLSHWNLQVFEHFDTDSYRYELDKEYEGIKGPWRKVFAELVNFHNEEDGVRRAQSIHVRYKTVKS
jgi:SAM-dependent methyltransferase